MGGFKRSAEKRVRVELRQRQEMMGPGKHLGCAVSLTKRREGKVWSFRGPLSIWVDGQQQTLLAAL